MSSDRALSWATVLMLLAASGCTDATGVASDGLTAPTPGVLTTEPIGMNSIRLRWVPVAASVRRYLIQRRADLQGDFVVIDSVPGNTGQYVDNKLEPETYYGYRLVTVTLQGGVSDASIVGGAKTAPKPSILVSVNTAAESSADLDPDGFQVRLAGTDTATAPIAAVADPPATRLFSPLKPGAYTVFLRGLANNCIRGDEQAELPSDSIGSVVVTDQGLDTRRTVNATVTCFNPSRGTLNVSVTTQNGVSLSGVKLNLSRAGGTTPYAGSRVLGSSGGTASFRNLLAGTYQLDLTGLASNCAVQGQASQSITISAATVSSQSFVVNCNVVNTALSGTDAGPDDATKPYKIRYTWSDSSAAPGSQVTLTATFDQGSGSPIAGGIGSLGLIIAVDPSVLEFVKADGISPWGVQASNTADQTGARGYTITSGAPQGGSTVPLMTITFTVKSGTTGRRITTSTKVSEVNDGDFNVNYGDGESTSPGLKKVQPRGRILVVGAAPTTTPPSTTPPTTTPPTTTPPTTTPPSGTQQPPVPVIAGSGQLSVLVGTPLQLSSAGTTDPQGLPLTYTWTASPTSATFSDPAAPNPSVTFSTAGTYTVILSVKNSANLSAFTTRTVVAVPPTTSTANIPPIAVIDGANPLTATTGVDLDLAARGSSDPDGTIVTYQWVTSGGSPASSTGVTSKVRYIVPGTYNVVLNVTDNKGASTQTTRSVVVTGAPVQPFTLTHEFGTPIANTVSVTATLDLTYDLGETPGPEEITGSTVQSITWNPAVLQFDALEPVNNFNVSTSNAITASSITGLNSRVTGTQFPRGRFALYKIRFKVLNPNGTSDLVVSGLSATPGPNISPYLVNYGSLVAITNGRFPQPAGTTATFGTVRGTVSVVSGTADLSGAQVDVVPAAAGAATRTATTVGSGSGVTYSITDVPVGTGTGAGQGQVKLRNLPPGCVAPIANYTGLTAVADVVVDVSVSCTASSPTPPAPTTGTVQGTVVRSGTGTQDLAGISVSVTPSGGSAVSATVSGSGGSVSWSAAGVTAGSGTVTVSNVPANCTAPASASYSGLVAGSSVTVPAITVTCTATAPPPSGPSVAHRHRAQWGAVSGGTVDLTLTWDPTACNPATLASCGVNGSVVYGGVSSAITLSGSASARIGSRTAQATPSFGVATLGAAGCNGASLCTGITATTTSTSLVTAQAYAILRYTVGSGSAGTVVTSSKVTEVSTPLGDSFTLVESGANQNLVYVEATLTLP